MNHLEPSSEHHQSPEAPHITPEFVNERVFGWGPTPLDPYLPGPISEQQDAVFKGLRERVRYEGSIRPNIPKHIRDYMENSFDSRFHQHANKSYNNYIQNGVHMDSEVLAKCGHKLELSLRGLAFPSEQLDILDALAMEAIELGYITMPYGDRIWLVEEMRASVNQAILGRGGRLCDNEEIPERFKIRHCDEMIEAGDNRVKDGILITRKRTVGIIEHEDVHVMERVSFILRIDEASGFDQEVADKLRTVKVGNNSTWPGRLWRLGNLEEIVPKLLAEENFNQIIPMATTSYAYNATIAALNRAERAGLTTDEATQLVMGRGALAQCALEYDDDQI